MPFVKFTTATLIARLNTAGPLEVTRSDPKEQNETGGWETKRRVTLRMDPATVHTVNGLELNQVPEADRNLEMIEIYVTERLFASDGNRDADRVTYEGRCYRIVATLNYSPQGNSFIGFGALEEPE